MLLFTHRHLILLGQDKRELGALVFPDDEQLQQLPDGGEDAAALKMLLAAEVARLNGKRPDFRNEENISRIMVRAVYWSCVTVCLLVHMLLDSLFWGQWQGVSRPSVLRYPLGVGWGIVVAGLLVLFLAGTRCCS